MNKLHARKTSKDKLIAPDRKTPSEHKTPLRLFDHGLPRKREGESDKAYVARLGRGRRM